MSEITPWDRLRDETSGPDPRTTARIWITAAAHLNDRGYESELAKLFAKLRLMPNLVMFICPCIPSLGSMLQLSRLISARRALTYLQLSGTEYHPHILSRFPYEVVLPMLKTYVGPVQYLQNLIAPKLGSVTLSATDQELLYVDIVIQRLEVVSYLRVLIHGSENPDGVQPKSARKEGAGMVETVCNIVCGSDVCRRGLRSFEVLTDTTLRTVSDMCLFLMMW